jgi:hypothetical protein
MADGTVDCAMAWHVRAVVVNQLQRKKEGGLIFELLLASGRWRREVSEKYRSSKPRKCKKSTKMFCTGELNLIELVWLQI